MNMILKTSQKNFEDSIVFAFKNYNQCHIKFSQNKYYINKNNSLIMSEKKKKWIGKSDL